MISKDKVFFSQVVPIRVNNLNLLTANVFEGIIQRGMAFTVCRIMIRTGTLSHRDFLKLDKNYEAAASAVDLVYVTDKDTGINRLKKGKGFTYTMNGKTITDEDTLERIKKLVIPPAWTKVWICKNANGHIQATGYDAANRKQYRYHPRWSAIQQETKFHRMYEFGKALPTLRKKLKEDLSQQGFPETKVLAMVVSLIDRTYIRVGNEGYEKLHGSYGITTLKNKHVTVKGDTIVFSFKGKKGVYHKISLRNKRFARIIRQCKAIPGSELFQYYEETGDLKKVDSGQVNQYIKECAQQEFTTKDFRTWAGTMTMLQLLRVAEPCTSLAAYKKQVNNSLKQVSEKLGNTVAVCKKYYVHPELINLYQQDQLARFFKDEIADNKTDTGLSMEEELLMKILKTIQREQTNPKLTEKLLRRSIRKVTQSNRKHISLRKKVSA